MSLLSQASLSAVIAALKIFLIHTELKLFNFFSPTASVARAIMIDCIPLSGIKT